MAVRHAESRENLEAVAALMRAFVAWHYRRHGLDCEMIDSYSDPEGFEKELRNLPGEFAPPEGALLVAEQGGRIAGCVALKPLGEGACELKRMFVSPDCHGKGLDLQLGRAFVDKACRIGYRKIMPDTGPEQREAQGLYPKLGFSKVDPLQGLPPRMREWLVFMALELRA